jgi:N4-(beta-N-acetylglucosaminyl)-L-asparaginase
MSKMNRRKFLKNSILGGTALGIAPTLLTVSDKTAQANPAIPDFPVVISSANGEKTTAKGMEMLRSGADPLDAIISGVNIVENDPEDITVGYGGLPNENGVVQLDASVMHGPTHNAGAVGALEGIKNPSKVAKLVMERTDHVLLVGEGAQAFAKAHGFIVENLLTYKAREIWLHWKENLNKDDDWLPPADDKIGLEIRKYLNVYGTINCCAVDGKGDIAGVTTTSGLSFKIPGRVGDSPIIGAGLYVDNEVGAAGSTGRGETNLKNLSCFMIVELMRQGKSPTDASLAVCDRIVKHTKLRYLLDNQGLPNFNVKFYAVSKNGQTGGASIYSGGEMWVVDKKGQRLEPLAFLFKRKE